MATPELTLMVGSPTLQALTMQLLRNAAPTDCLSLRQTQSLIPGSWQPWPQPRGLSSIPQRYPAQLLRKQSCAHGSSAAYSGRLAVDCTLVLAVARGKALKRSSR